MPPGTPSAGQHRSADGTGFVANQNLKPDMDKYVNRMMVQNVVTGCTIIMNRKLKDLTIPIPEGAITHDWWISFVAASFGRIHHIPRPTILYRQHAGNASGGAQKWNFRYIFDIFWNKRNKILQSSFKTKRQAQAFLERYGCDLDAKTFRLIASYAHMDNSSFLKKRLKMIRNGYFKIGFFRNLGWLTFI